MFKLSDCVDVKDIFEALATLPDQMAEARRGILDAQGVDEQVNAKMVLANLETKFSATSDTIRLIQTVGALQFADAVDLAARLREEADATWDDEIPF